MVHSVGGGIFVGGDDTIKRLFGQKRAHLLFAKAEVYKRSNRADVAYSNDSFITDSLAGIIKTLMVGTAHQMMGRVMHF